MGFVLSFFAGGGAWLSGERRRKEPVRDFVDILEDLLGNMALQKEGRADRVRS